MSNKRTQLKIYSMFMLADGECSVQEKEKLNSICKGMDINSDDKKEVLEYCKGLSIKQGDNSGLILRELDKLLDSSPIFSIFAWSSLSHNPRLQVETIWTLINLGYADTEFSKPEKKVVDYLVTKWNIKKIIINELMDTANTILMLTQQKEWLKTTRKPYDEIERRIYDIDKRIQLMFDNVKTSISEADAV